MDPNARPCPNCENRCPECGAEMYRESYEAADGAMFDADPLDWYLTCPDCGFDQNGGA